MKVVTLPKSTCDQFVLKKHYSHRVPFFTNGFGLVIGGKIEGVCVYGQTSAPIALHAFADRDFPVIELARLVVQTSRKNAASFLVGNSLQMMDKPCAVVSYADTEMGHAGIIYQATNWIYTGATVSHDHAYIVNGERVHPRSLVEKGITDPKRWARENGIETVAPEEKHRYFFLTGNRTERKRMRAKLKYQEVTPYPKLPKSEYDDGVRIEMCYGNRCLWEAMADPTKK